MTNPRAVDQLTEWERELAEVAARAGSEVATARVERLADRLSAGRATSTPAATTRATWPGLAHRRAAEHMVADIDVAAAATPHGVVALDGRTPAGWVEALAVDRMARLLGRLPLVEVADVFPNGAPLQLPTFTTEPTAGEQAGQKNPAYSKAFTVAADAAATIIDASLHLNVSAQLDTLAPGVVDQFMRLAVVAECERQVLAAITAGATAGGADVGSAAATFTGSLYAPSLLVLPVANLLTEAANITMLSAAGITVVLSPFASAPLLLDPAAVVGYLAELSLSAVEPSVLGRGHTEQLYGQVSVAAAGVASYTPAAP